MSTKIILLPQVADTAAANYEAELEQAYKSIKKKRNYYRAGRKRISLFGRCFRYRGGFKSTQTFK